MSAVTESSAAESSFRHLAMFYAGADGFVAGTVPFIEQGLAAGEPVLVVVDQTKIGLLCEALGGQASGVTFADMAEVGANPARIIPAWDDFVSQVAWGRPCRGIGEPIYPERRQPELLESQRHESLLNRAFDDGPAWSLLCPYDTTLLSEEVLSEARRTHPLLVEDGTERASEVYRDLGDAAAWFERPLPEPPAGAAVARLDGRPLASARRFVAAGCEAAGLDRQPTADLVLAVHEVVANSIRHGGGHPTLRMWQDGDGAVCDVVDTGRLDDPLVGRVRPRSHAENGRGLWMANLLCDLVQIHSSPSGNLIRLHMYR